MMGDQKRWVFIEVLSLYLCFMFWIVSLLLGDICCKMNVFVNYVYSYLFYFWGGGGVGDEKRETKPGVSLPITGDDTYYCYAKVPFLETLLTQLMCFKVSKGDYLTELDNSETVF